MRKTLAIIISALMILTAVPALGADASLSSSYDGLTGVPVCADIPLDFSLPVSAVKSDITVTPETPFEVEGSDTSYTIKFTEDMLYGSLYTVSTPYGSISYRTAYGTYLAQITVNTPAGEGRTAQFGKDISEFTMKIDFMPYTELPSNKWITLYDDAKANMGIMVSNEGGYITLGLMRYDAPSASWKGPAVERSKLAADFSDTAYVTVKDNTARIFVVSKDGTVTYGQNWNFSGSTIANCVFDSVSIDSILFGVEVGNTEGTCEEGGGDEPDPGEEPDPGDEPDPEPDSIMSCNLDGAEFVPASAGIPVSFTKEIILMQSDISITADGQPVTNFSLDTDDDINYLITVNGGMQERADYKIVINSDEAPELADDPIEFSTGYKTDKESMTVKYDGNEQALSRPVEQFTMYAEVTEASYSVGSYKYAVWYDISDSAPNSLKSEKYIEFMMSRTASETEGYGIAAFIKNGEDDTKHQISLVEKNTIPLNGSSPVITLKDGALYVYYTSNDGSVTYCGAKDVSSFISDFKVGSIGGRGTNYLTVYTGYGERLLAEVIQSGAETGDKIKVEFSSKIASYPEKTTVTDGSTSVSADVEINGVTAVLTLNDDLKYNSVFEIDLSGFKDRLGENSASIEFETTPAPKFYRADNAVFMINGTETAVLSSGLLTVSLPVERLRKSKFDSVDMIVAVYKKVEGKQYLYSIKKAARASFQPGEKKTVTSEAAVNIPSSADGAEYFAKVFLYPADTGRFSLVPSQILN